MLLVLPATTHAHAPAEQLDVAIDQSSSPSTSPDKQTLEQPPTMAKFAFFTALLLAIATVQLAYAEDASLDIAPFDSIEGSGFLNTTLEERCCL